jgi:hypothetical protein
MNKLKEKKSRSRKRIAKGPKNRRENTKKNNVIFHTVLSLVEQ